MLVSGRFRVLRDRGQVFETLTDILRIGQCIPGCSELEAAGDGRYAAKVRVEVGFLKLVFDVSVEVVEVAPPELIRFRIQGKPAGLSAQLTATAELRAKPDDGEPQGPATVVEWQLDQTLKGALGGIGQPVFRAKAEEQGARFAQNLQRLLESVPEGERL
jgi:carbon monoxide dehydrogenase subunit G